MQEDGVLAPKWHDKRDVLMLSTYHDSSMVEKSRRCKCAGVETIQKPKVVEDYNQYMGGVDLSKSIIVIIFTVKYMHDFHMHICSSY